MRHIAGSAATEMTPQTCEICGYVMAPALGHSFGTEWISDQQTHYHACACGEKQDVANHTWDEGKKTDNGKVFTCTICQYQFVEPQNLTPLFIGGASAAVAVAAGGVVAAILLKRKRQ